METAPTFLPIYFLNVHEPAEEVAVNCGGSRATESAPLGDFSDDSA